MIIKIDDFFYSAGKKFNWKGNSLGVGLDKRKVIQAYQNKEDITITVKNYKKTISPESILALGRRYNSYYTAGKTELIVIPWEDQSKPIQKTIESVLG